MFKEDLNSLEPYLNKKVAPYKTQFNKIWPMMHLEVFEPEEAIVRYDHEISMLRFLIEGKGKITMVHEDGKCSIIHFVRPDEFIGELSFIDVEEVTKDVTAITQCYCLSIPMKLAKENLLKDSEFLLMINQYIGKKLLKRTWLNTKSQNYELKHRLAAYILMASCYGLYKEKHTETAEFLGVSYRHLLHTFKSFLEEKILVKEGRKYRINLEALELLAKDINS